mmetsp:Transcript_40117/g.63677  ORF Transcript_40117/g.63677 Transcript_40117/m.63677 type:complete len:451 (-) Transcript_40117:103-1455(-)
MAQTAQKPNPLNGNAADWQVVWDVTHNRWYYAEKETQRVSWEQPEGCSLELPKNRPAGSENLHTLPTGWRAYYDPASGKMCFQNLATKKAQWTRPDSNSNGTVGQTQEQTSASNAEALPAGWRRVKHDESQRYYYVGPNNVTQWEHPSENADKSKAPPAQITRVSSNAESEWEPRWDSDNRRWCFLNPKTGKHQYDKRPEGFTKQLPEPPLLPAGWSAAWNIAENRFYYLSPEKKPQWEPPPIAQENATPKKTAVDDTNNLARPKNVAKAPNTAKQEEPRENLPPGWEKAFNEEHKRDYYFNRATNKSQWHLPDTTTTVNNETERNPEKTVATLANEEQTKLDKTTTGGSNLLPPSVRNANEKTISDKTVTENTFVTPSNEAKSSPTSTPPTKQKLSRTQLEVLAKLVLKDDANKPEIDVNGLLAKFWRDRSSTETTLEEFLIFIGVKQP